MVTNANPYGNTVTKTCKYSVSEITNSHLHTPIECSFLHHLLTHDNPKDGGVAKDGNDDHDGEEGVPEEGRG